MAERPGAGRPCQGSPRPVSLAPRPLPRSLPGAPRPPEPAAGSATAPAAEVGSPRRRAAGTGTGRGGRPVARALRDRRVAFPARVRASPRAIVSPRRGPCARSLARWLARSLPRRLPGLVPRLSAFLLPPSLLPPSGGRAEPWPGPGGSKLRRGSWAAAVGARRGVRGPPCLGTKLFGAAGQQRLPVAALGLFLGRGLKGVPSQARESLSLLPLAGPRPSLGRGRDASLARVRAGGAERRDWELQSWPAFVPPLTVRVEAEGPGRMGRTWVSNPPGRGSGGGGEGGEAGASRGRKMPAPCFPAGPPGWGWNPGWHLETLAHCPAQPGAQATAGQRAACPPVQEGPPDPNTPGSSGRKELPALPLGLGSGKGSWEEPWAPSHHSPGSWL